MRLRAFLKLGIAAVAVSLSALSARAADPGITDTEITLGLFAPMSGPLAAFGLDPIQVSKAYYEDVNKRGGVHGRKFKILLEDDKCDTNEMQAIARKFVSVDKVFLLHGGSCTAGAQALQGYVTREQVPFIVLNAGADGALFPPTRYVFGGNVGTQFSSGGAVMQFAINELKGKKIAFIVHDDDIGTANWRTAKAAAQKAGVEVVAYERVPPRASDVTATILNVRRANPDVIAAVVYPAPAALVLQKYGEFGMKQPVVYGVQAVPAPATLAKNVANDAAFANFYYGTPLAEEAKLTKWNDLYKAYYPDRPPGPWVGFGVPTAAAIVAAFEKAGRDVTREKFVDALETINLDSGALAGNSVFGKDRRDSFRTMAFIKFDGTKSVRMPNAYTWDGSIADP